MPKTLKIMKMLSGKHLEAFHAILPDRQTTIDSARKWLTDRGYSVSRKAVWTYRKAFISKPQFVLRARLYIGNDADMRRQLKALIERMSGADLVTVVMHAAFVLNTSATNQRRRRR